jgi:transposase
MCRLWRSNSVGTFACDFGDSVRGVGDRGYQSADCAMIPLPTGVRVWIAAGHTDMRRGMQSLALQVQEGLKRDPHAGDLYVFRGRGGSLIKILWHDGISMSLYAKRLERGRFIWPSATSGVVLISASQLAYMLDGIDWRNPQHTWRPTAAG